MNIYGGKWVKKRCAKCSRTMWRVPAGHDRRHEEGRLPAPPGTFGDLRRLIQGYLGEGNKMGEGWLLTAEMLELIPLRHPNIVCNPSAACQTTLWARA